MTDNTNVENETNKASPEPTWDEAMKEQQLSTNEAKPASLEKFDGNNSTANAGNPSIDLILDIPVNLAIEVGRTSISIRDLLQLGQGSVVELDRLEGEPLDVLVNGTLVAHGEVVVINDNFGIRLTDIISQNERIQKLKSHG